MDPRRLREETRAEHEATEALMPLTDPNLTLERYIAMLERLYPLVWSWEVWAREGAPVALRPLLASRQRSSLLAADLGVFGIHVEALQGNTFDWQQVVFDGGDSDAEAARMAKFLGAFYVFEGSTLGGRYIARQVETTLNIQPGTGDRFFRGHEEKTAALWQEVLSSLRSVPDALEPLVIEAARRAFRAFGLWLRSGDDAHKASLADVSRLTSI